MCELLYFGVINDIYSSGPTAPQLGSRSDRHQERWNPPCNDRYARGHLSIRRLSHRICQIFSIPSAQRAAINLQSHRDQHSTTFDAAGARIMNKFVHGEGFLK